MQWLLIWFLLGCGPTPSIENGHEYISGVCYEIRDGKIGQAVHDSKCLFDEPLEE